MPYAIMWLMWLWQDFTICSFSSINLCWWHPRTYIHTLTHTLCTHICVRLLGQRGSSIIYCLRSVFFYPLFSPCGKQNSWPVTFFCWLQRPSAALANGFTATLVSPQNTPWHEWHPKVGNSICQWILHCGTDGGGYVSIISRLSAERFLKAE